MSDNTQKGQESIKPQNTQRETDKLRKKARSTLWKWLNKSNFSGRNIYSVWKFCPRFDGISCRSFIRQLSCRCYFGTYFSSGGILLVHTLGSFLSHPALGQVCRESEPAVIQGWLKSWRSINTEKWRFMLGGKSPPLQMGFPSPLAHSLLWVHALQPQTNNSASQCGCSEQPLLWSHTVVTPAQPNVPSLSWNLLQRGGRTSLAMMQQSLARKS